MVIVAVVWTNQGGTREERLARGDGCISGDVHILGFHLSVEIQSNFLKETNCVI